MKKWLKTVIIILIIIIVIGILGGVAFYRYREKIALILKKPDEKLDISTSVVVYKAGLGLINESLILNGDVVPETEVNIYSTVPGKIKDILARDGDEVGKGSVLAFIDRSEAGLTFAPTPIESTIDGIVKKVLMENGDYVTPQLPLFQIININYVEVVVHIPEKDISRIKQGIETEVTVVSYPNKTFYGKVSKISPVVDPMSRTLEARILINNSRRMLKPGMFGEVRIILRRKNDALIIPLSAVIDRDGRNVVFIEEEGRAVQVEPLFDIREGNTISVLKGLVQGQNVIVIGQHNVSSGDMVTITEVLE